MKRSLVAVLAVALVVRLVVLAELADQPFARVLLGDAEIYAAWAHRIADGDWLGHEVFYQAPLYPYFLAVVFALGGGILAAKVFQLVLGALACVLLAATAGRLFGSRAGLVAGLLAALYAPSIWLEGILQKTALATFLTALFVWHFALVLEREEDDEGLRLADAFGLGLLLGLLALVRENALILVVPVALFLALSRPRRRGLVPLVLGLSLVLAPVGWRNARLGGGFLPTASNAGVNFYIGNHAAADGLYTPLVRGRGHARFEEADARSIAEQRTGRELSPAGVSLFWFQRGLDDVREAPARWIQLVAWKAELTIHRSEQMDSEAFEAHRAGSRVLDVLGWVFHFGLLLPLTIVGLGSALRERGGLWPLALAILMLVTSLLAFFVAARFRIGIAVLAMPFAGYGAVELVDGLRDRARRRAALPPTLLAAFFALVANVPLGIWPLSLLGSTSGSPLAATASNVSSAYLALGDAEAAYASAAEALKHDEDDVLGVFNLAEAARLLGRMDEARAAFAEAAVLEPAFAGECHLKIGLTWAAEGRLEPALDEFRASVSADPNNARAHYNLGLALRQSGRDEEAARAYRASIRLDPSFPDAHHNLGFLRERQGRPEEARRHYEDALAADPRFALSLEHLARLLIRAGSGARAVELARRRVELDAQPDWRALELLADALLSAGDREGARVTLSRAARACGEEGQRRRLEERAGEVGG